MKLNMLRECVTVIILFRGRVLSFIRHMFKETVMVMRVLIA